jgi:hypothetical protein
MAGHRRGVGGAGIQTAGQDESRRRAAGETRTGQHGADDAGDAGGLPSHAADLATPPPGIRGAGPDVRTGPATDFAHGRWTGARRVDSAVERRGPSPAIPALALLATHAPALAQVPVVATPSSLTRIAVMVGAALVGAVVGLIPAVLVGSALGVVPRPARAPAAPGASEPSAQPQALAAPGPPPPPDPRSEPVAAAHVRHRELYEAEYSWQELRLDALRHRIGAELADRARGAAGDPAPRPGRVEVPRKPAKGR